jgi:hypothetical protein
MYKAMSELYLAGMVCGAEVRLATGLSARERSMLLARGRG